MQPRQPQAPQPPTRQQQAEKRWPEMKRGDDQMTKVMSDFIRCHAMSYDTMQRYTMSYNVIWYYTMLYNVMRCHAIIYNAMRYHTILYNVIRYYTMLDNVIQCHTILCNVIQCYANVISPISIEANKLPLVSAFKPTGRRSSVTWFLRWAIFGSKVMATRATSRDEIAACWLLLMTRCHPRWCD